MREFCDGILSEIGSESLTDEEFDTIPEDLTPEYSKEVYEALRSILQDREGVSGQLKKLQSYFIAKGSDLTGNARLPMSHIFIGAPL